VAKARATGDRDDGGEERADDEASAPPESQVQFANEYFQSGELREEPRHHRAAGDLLEVLTPTPQAGASPRRPFAFTTGDGVDAGVGLGVGVGDATLSSVSAAGADGAESASGVARACAVGAGLSGRRSGSRGRWARSVSLMGEGPGIEGVSSRALRWRRIQLEYLLEGDVGDSQGRRCPCDCAAGAPAPASAGDALSDSSFSVIELVVAELTLVVALCSGVVPSAATRVLLLAGSSCQLRSSTDTNCFSRSKYWL